MPSRILNARKRRVFNSVFGCNTPQPTPTPTPTPEKIQEHSARAGQRSGGLLYSSRGHPLATPLDGHNLGSFPVQTNADDSDDILQQDRWDISWRLVTHTLYLPKTQEQRGVLEPLLPDRESIDPDFYNALELLLFPEIHVPLARHTEDIVVWHSSQVRHHFLNQVLPMVLQLRDHYASDAVLLRGLKILENAHRKYQYGLSFIKEQIELTAPGTSRPALSKFQSDLNAVVSSAVMDVFSEPLAAILGRYVSIILGLPSKLTTENGLIEAESPRSEKARREILGLTETFKNLGLAGEGFQVIFAEVMNDAISKFVTEGCKGIWSRERVEFATTQVTRNKKTASSEDRDSILPKPAQHPHPSRCVKDICDWIENRYAKLAVQVLSLLDSRVSLSWAEKEKYKEMGIDRLAELRIKELFHVVEHWPHSSGALDDLRTAITTTQRRLHLTDVFAQNLSLKLLHPGTSTLRILQTYISMIWSFHSLDHSKVLLDRVAYPLQLYLCTREDMVRIIITGLLADAGDAYKNPQFCGGEKLVELAQLLNTPCEAVGQRAGDEEMDWHDMDWIPDPVDAGPGYKRSKNADIIGTLIGDLGSQEVFIKEFQNIIGENLLKHHGAFDKEIKVLELLKTRFGEGPLQACEVMLKDIQDSGRVNSIIRKTQNLGPSQQEMDAAQRNLDFLDSHVNPECLYQPSLHAKILSRLFWPQLRNDTYRIPPQVAELQRKYEKGFETLKSARKLTWLHSLGQAKVDLELEDRKVVENVHTWQATVIWAFQDRGLSGPATERSVTQLVESLDMEEALVRSALRFWTSKLVLQEVSPDKYAVLETLNQEDRARSNAQTAASAVAGGSDENTKDHGLTSDDGIAKETMYWQFITGMLTNSSSQMALHQIAMMLKMLIADGFPYSNEELQEFLGHKVANGELELVSGKYRLKK